MDLDCGEEKISGKAYVHRSGNKIGDGYLTPKSLIWIMEDVIKKEFNKDEMMIEPAAGVNERPIVEALREIAYAIDGSDLYHNSTGRDYLTCNKWRYDYKYVITNPPFSLWDEFILRAKEHCKKFMFIGRTNYYGSNNRLLSGINCFKCDHFKSEGTFCNKYNVCIIKAKCKQKEEEHKLMADSLIWRHLKAVYPFSRYVDYQTPYRNDGMFHVGNMETAWFLWDMEYEGPFITEIMDVQKWATLGAFKKNKK